MRLKRQRRGVRLPSEPIGQCAVSVRIAPANLPCDRFGQHARDLGSVRRCEARSLEGRKYLGINLAERRAGRRHRTRGEGVRDGVRRLRQTVEKERGGCAAIRQNYAIIGSSVHGHPLLW